MHSEETYKHIKMMREKGYKYKHTPNNGLIFYKPKKIYNKVILESTKRPVVFTKRVIRKPVKLLKKKSKFAEEKKFTRHKLKRNIILIKIRKRKTKLWKTPSGLVFKLPKKAFWGSVLEYFLQRFNVKFAKFKTLNLKYVIYMLTVFSKKAVCLLLKQNRLAFRTKNKRDTKSLAFYFFWQVFLSRFFDIFSRKDLSSGFFNVENKLQRQLFNNSLTNWNRRKKKRYNLQRFLVQRYEKAKTFNCFVTDRIKYLMNSFGFSKRLHKRKQSKFKDKESQKNLKYRHSDRKRYKKQKRNTVFKWLVLENKTVLKKKAIFVNSKSNSTSKLKSKEASVMSEVKNYIRYGLYSRPVNFLATEEGLNLFVQNRKDVTNFAININHWIVIKITTTNIYLTILSCRLVTVAKFSIGLAGFRKKKVKKQNYVLKKINSILICFLLQYVCKWQARFGVLPRFRVVIRSGFINKRLKILLNNFFYFVKKRRGAIRSSLYFKRKHIRTFSKNYINRFKRKYRFFNFGFTHYTPDTYMNKFTFNKQRFNLKYTANRYINFIKLASGFNKLVYYFQKRSEWLRLLKNRKSSEFSKKTFNYRNQFRIKWPNLRTFDAKRSRCWANINLFFYLHFKYNKYLITKNYKKIKTISNLNKTAAGKKIIGSQLPPAKMWYNFNQKTWDSVAKNQVKINKRNK